MRTPPPTRLQQPSLLGQMSLYARCAVIYFSKHRNIRGWAKFPFLKEEEYFLFYIYNPQIRSKAGEGQGRGLLRRTWLVTFSIFNLKVRPAKHKDNCQEIIFYRDKCCSSNVNSLFHFLSIYSFSHLLYSNYECIDQVYVVCFTGFTWLIFLYWVTSKPDSTLTKLVWNTSS